MHDVALLETVALVTTGKLIFDFVLGNQHYRFLSSNYAVKRRTKPKNRLGVQRFRSVGKR